MKDRLEDFIQQNRQDFDLHEPDPSLWLRINTIDAPKKLHRLTWFRYAAAVAVIFASVSIGIYYSGGAVNNSEGLYGKLYSEIMETEAYYKQVIDKKYKELQPYFSASPQLREDVDIDFVELDEIYGELKNDLKDNAGNQEVIEAMIMNYRVKVSILEDLLDQLNEKEDQENEDENEYDL